MSEWIPPDAVRIDFPKKPPKPRHTRRLLVFAGLALLSASPLAAQGGGRKVFGQGHPFTAEELPEGELKAKLKVTAHKFTATAKAAIEAAGGEAVTW